MHLPRRLPAALALGLTLLATAACDLEIAPAGAAPRGSTAPRIMMEETLDDPEFREDLRTAEQVVNGFWARHWSELFTGAYRPPTVVGLYNGRDPATTPMCGDRPLERNNAAYCPAGDYVAWDITLMRNGYARGDAWVYLVIAHEWGHAIQDRLRRDLVSPAAELQADCLAGATLYGAAADGAVRFEAGDEEEIVRSFRVIGDDVPWTKPGDHGSAAERLRFFERGGDGGVSACFRTT
ncbi:neutral zinc metallopeptidase [Actinomadura kijaniata]|uniref:neutral zinc metallopeptidase n=1 Tax=Actinomadura kijaniata TaxID=46161 RepID=UPI000835BAD1|nr:neutral zinc metallopeptidase [Actinomadura kijaniata]